uniref:MCF.2 cell line derived transforming sequence b n=1 Tax=Scophthalmus maximus TaxID=52904 RepID=A0A8D3ED16_SCOMX
MTLFLFQTSFPGNLHLVLVLQPGSLLGSAPSPSSGTDLGFRFSQDDFLLKMPVVMLRSVGELLRYIDENHLTSDFTAKVEYCQSDWVVLRTSIETFAVTVKEIAQLLQGFGSELSETDIPDEANAVEFLLHSHTHRYRQMKVCHSSVFPSHPPPLVCLPCRSLALCVWWHVLIFSLVAVDMEEAFDGFFEKHHLKLQQYTQLLQYEISFQQKGIASVGTTLVETEQLLKDLETLDKHAQEEMARAQVVILHGHQLAANHHYALALIVQHCNELRHHCDIITAAIRTKRASLTRARDLLHRLEDALRWCDEGAYLLASQMVDRFQTREGAQEALQYLSIHQERAPSALKNSQDTLSLEFEATLTPQLQMTDNPPPLSLLSTFYFAFSSLTLTLCRHIMKELIATERVYVDELLSVLLGYRAEMEDPSMSHLLPSALRSQKDVLFGNMPEIYQFHSRIFLEDLQSCLETPERVGACFLHRKEKFQVYERYCQNKSRSELLWRQCSDSPFFQECQKKLEHKLGLDSYLLKPVQRLAKYQLLLKELLRHRAEERYRCELQDALDSMLELLKSVNDSMHQIAITGYQGDLSQLGRVVLQGGFSVWISHKRAAVRMKELARFKPMQRHLFLYDHALLFCKRRDEDNHDRTPFYSFKSCLRMSAVGITENVKGDLKKFEIWYNGREVVYIVQAPTVEVKVAWLTEIRKILTNQQKLCQGLCSCYDLLSTSMLLFFNSCFLFWGTKLGSALVCLLGEVQN